MAEYDWRLDRIQPFQEMQVAVAQTGIGGV